MRFYHCLLFAFAFLICLPFSTPALAFTGGFLENKTPTTVVGGSANWVWLTDNAVSSGFMYPENTTITYDLGKIYNVTDVVVYSFTDMLKVEFLNGSDEVVSTYKMTGYERAQKISFPVSSVKKVRITNAPGTLNSTINGFDIFVKSPPAYAPGLLYGKTLIGDGATKNLHFINDNDPDTNTNVTYNFSYIFDEPIDLSAYYINGTSLDWNSRITFYREDGSIIKEIRVYTSTTNKLGVLQPEEILQVKKVMYHNGDSFYDYISDFEVYKAADLRPPGDPQNVIATAISDKQIKITWTPPTDADFDRVHIYQGATRIATVPKSSATATISGLTPDTEYSFVVRAVDESANESKGITVTARTLEPPPTDPPPPESVRIELDGAATFTSAKFKFQAAKASAIKFYRDSKEIAAFPGNATMYEDTSLQPGTSYKFWIVAENAIGRTASAIITVNTPQLPKPSEVKISAQNIKDTSVELVFSTVDADSIKLYRDGKEVTVLPGKATFYKDNNLNQNTAYRYWIVAVNNQGATASEIIEVKTPVGKIQNLRVAEQKTDRIKIAWDANPLAEKYIVEVVIKRYKTASIGMSDIVSAPPEERKEFESTNTYAEIENVSPGDKLSFFVSGYTAEQGKFGTSSLNVSVPIFDSPPSENMPTAKEVVDSSFSLAFNFWVFFLIGAALLVSPWLFQVARSALGRKRQEPEESPRRAARELRRKIRADLRGG